MKLFRHAIVGTGLIAAFAVPALAANHSMDATMMTCAEFTAMDEEGQMKSLEAMHMALDDMALDKMMPDEMASEAAAPKKITLDDMAPDEMTAIASACEGKPGTMALDAMMSN